MVLNDSVFFVGAGFLGEDTEFVLDALVPSGADRSTALGVANSDKFLEPFRAKKENG